MTICLLKSHFKFTIFIRNASKVETPEVALLMSVTLCFSTHFKLMELLSVAWENNIHNEGYKGRLQQ